MKSLASRPAARAWGGLLLAGVLVPALSLAQETPRPEPPARGLAFAVALTRGGRSHSGDTFDLRVPGAKGTLRLVLEQLTYEAGTLHAVARLTNRTGGALGGLRLSLRQVSHASGPISVPPFVPLEVGDLKDGATSAGAVFQVGSLSFDGRAEPLVVLGEVSGIASSAAVEVPESTDVTAIGTDEEGRLLLADASGRRLLRAGADGKGTVVVARLACAPRGVAAAPNGDGFLASCDGSPGLLRVPRSGARPSPVDVPGSLGLLRTGAGGVVRAVSGSSLVALGPGGKRIRAGAPVAGFDVRADGTVRLVAGRPLDRRLLAGESGGTSVRPLGGAAASMPRASTCRFGPDGLYVAEGAVPDASGAEATARLVVLDDAGALVREARILERAARDLVFGPDGRLWALLEGSGPARLQLLRLF